MFLLEITTILIFLYFLVYAKTSKNEESCHMDCMYYLTCWLLPLKVFFFEILTCWLLLWKAFFDAYFYDHL